MAVRVLRLLEYTYPDAATAEMDMTHWQIQGSYSPRKGMIIRSSVIRDYTDNNDLEDAERYREIMEAVKRDSLASDGLEMIQAVLREMSENNDAS